MFVTGHFRTQILSSLSIICYKVSNDTPNQRQRIGSDKGWNAAQKHPKKVSQWSTSPYVLHRGNNSSIQAGGGCLCSLFREGHRRSWRRNLSVSRTLSRSKVSHTIMYQYQYATWSLITSEMRWFKHLWWMWSYRAAEMNNIWACTFPGHSFWFPAQSHSDITSPVCRSCIKVVSKHPRAPLKRQVQTPDASPPPKKR